ncbi:MAG: helix-turn-helix transcriptional regulator [Clostridia bacterium]|nr:helix-turn-helix transcriptional regulator [Clostridia bacterium]MBQ2948890.1 helix-turn-helix transcriptional regulator [Clostridia bacterium]MBQ4609045.1 helix-turn-helix transcriptional regulator [Clostridia bacterium]MBQ6858762.1 helix-turn-helix transcriptional regulator [Clostridia bacterium]MBQ7053517.1 helix-turn-helix transcriptional regulator [Clostridia bacterium]
MIVSYKTIGQNIRLARREAGLTQEQIAEKLKMSQLHFGRLERGERPASLEQLAQIARTLNVPLASLLNGCVIEEDFSAARDDSAQALGRDVARIASGCSSRARRLMRSLCQAVAASEKLPENE